MFGQMMLGGEPVLSLPGIIVSAAGGPAQLQIRNDGNIFATVLGFTTPSDQGDWINPRSAAGANYEIECVVNAGTVSAGSAPTGVGVWSNLGTTRTWLRAGVGAQQCTITLSIRKVGSSSVLATQQYTLERDD